MAHYSPVRQRSHSTAGRTIRGKGVGPAGRGRRGKGGGEWTRNASMCRDGPLPSLPSRLPLILTDKVRPAVAGLCTLREVQSTSRPPSLTHYPFEPCLTKSRLTGQVSRCLWRRGRRSCPPKPADTRCQFLLMHGSGLYGGMTECRKEDGLCWWYVSAWPSGGRNEGMQPYSPPPPDCLALMLMD